MAQLVIITMSTKDFCKQIGVIEMTKRNLSPAALSAKAIRSELKASFPGIKFSVRSDNFAGGDAVRVEWVNGPTQPAVESIVEKYQYGHFNGMEDIYEFSNKRADIPQAKYVTASRIIERDLMLKAFEDLKSHYEALRSVSDLNEYVTALDEYACSIVRKGFWHYDLTNGYCWSEYLEHDPI